VSLASKLVIITCTVTLAAGIAFAQATPEAKPAWPAYLFSIFLGFGTGQYWVGENGNLFLIGDASCVGVVALGAVMASLSAGTSPPSAQVTVGYVMVGVGAIALSVFRIWELIDIFGVVDTARKSGKVAEIDPVIIASPASFGLGAQLHL
jgi:hypothetical protein